MVKCQERTRLATPQEALTFRPLRAAAQNHRDFNMGSFFDRFGDWFGDFNGAGTDWKSFPSKYLDPLGPRADGKMDGPTGGPEQRDQIFSRIDTTRPQIFNASDQAANTAFKSAADPGFGAGADLARRTIGGEFLNGTPEFNSQMDRNRVAGNREVSDAEAALKSQMAMSGVGFSTANQQAQQGNRTLATARMNDAEANARAANYANERALQNAGTGQLNEALSSPLNYLSQVSAAHMAPLSQMVQIIAGLTGQGQQSIDRVEEEQWARQLGTTIGKL